MGIAAAADRGAATGSAALEEAAAGCGAAAGAMTTTEPLEPAPAEAMFSELYEFSSARAGVANDVSTNIAPSEKNEAKRDEGAKSPRCSRCEAGPCMSALCSIQLLNGGYEKHIEVERKGTRGRTAKDV